MGALIKRNGLAQLWIWFDMNLTMKRSKKKEGSEPVVHLVYFMILYMDLIRKKGVQVDCGSDFM